MANASSELRELRLPGLRLRFAPNAQAPCGSRRTTVAPRFNWKTSFLVARTCETAVLEVVVGPLKSRPAENSSEKGARSTGAM
jgi:hypothetical protein